MSEAQRLPAVRYARFESLREYEDRLDALIPVALSRIRIFDRRLGIRYNSRLRCGLLRSFLLGDPARELSIVVHEADALVRDCPRLVALALELHPRVQIRQTFGPARLAHDPCVIVDLNHHLHRFHDASMRASQGTEDGAGTRALLERFREIWAASLPVRCGPPAGL